MLCGVGRGAFLKELGVVVPLESDIGYIQNRFKEPNNKLTFAQYTVTRKLLSN